MSNLVRQGFISGAVAIALMVSLVPPAIADDHVSSKATLLQQYSCHVSYGYAFWLAGFHWDLEKARADYPGWNSNPNVHRCNW